MNVDTLVAKCPRDLPDGTPCGYVLDPRRPEFIEEIQIHNDLVHPGDRSAAVYALPPQPPVGAMVRGRRWCYIRRDDSSVCWAAGSCPEDVTAVPAWTWGAVLDDGPVRLIQLTPTLSQQD